MKTWTVGLVSWAVLAGLALGADKKEMTPEEKEKVRTQISALQDQLTAWLCDEVKEMPASLKEREKNGILGSRKKMIKALPEKLTAPSSKKHKVLVITLVHPQGHHVDAQGAMLAMLQQMGKKTDAWELTQAAEADLGKLTAEALKGYDAVVINNNFPLAVNPDADAEYTAKIKAFCDELLPNYVKGGGGLFVYHWGMTNFSKPFVQMLGGSFGGHPPGDGEVFPVKVLDPKNPLMAPFTGEVKPQVIYGKTEVKVPSEFQDELYVYGVKPDKDPAVRVLLTMDMEKLPPKLQFPKGTTAYPVIWVKHFGEGRIFYSQFGHSASILSVPVIAQSMLDGLQYVLGDLKAEDAPMAVPASAPAEK